MKDGGGVNFMKENGRMGRGGRGIVQESRKVFVF